MECTYITISFQKDTNKLQSIHRRTCRAFAFFLLLFFYETSTLIVCITFCDQLLVCISYYDSCDICRREFCERPT